MDCFRGGRNPDYFGVSCVSYRLCAGLFIANHLSAAPKGCFGISALTHIELGLAIAASLTTRMIRSHSAGEIPPTETRRGK